MQIRILLPWALGIIACEPLEPLLVVQAAPAQTIYVQGLAGVQSVPRAQACSAGDVRTSCDEVRRACASAGFYEGGVVAGKGIKVDCLEPLMRGASAGGVIMSVRPEELACINAEWSSARQRSEAAANDFENTCIYTNPSVNESKQEACDDVVRACAAGGYYSGGMDRGLGVLVDCLDPLRSGKRPARVDLAPATLHACFGRNLDDAEGNAMATERAPVLAPPPFHNPRRR